MTVFAIWLGWQVSVVRKRQNMRKELEAASRPSQLTPYNTMATEKGTIVFDNLNVQMWGELSGRYCDISWARKFLGDQPLPVMCLPYNMTDEQFSEFKRMFPEAEVTQMLKHPSPVVTE